VEQWEERREEGLLIWDSSVWEKPESLKSEGLGPVQSSKAKRLTHVKPICVPGLHWIGLLLVGSRLSLPSRFCGKARLIADKPSLFTESGMIHVLLKLL